MLLEVINIPLGTLLGSQYVNIDRICVFLKLLDRQIEGKTVTEGGGGVKIL